MSTTLILGSRSCGGFFENDRSHCDRAAADGAAVQKQLIGRHQGPMLRPLELTSGCRRVDRLRNLCVDPNCRSRLESAEENCGTTERDGGQRRCEQGTPHAQRRDQWAAERATQRPGDDHMKLYKREQECLKTEIRTAEIRRAGAADSPDQQLLEAALNCIRYANRPTWVPTPTSSAS